MGDKKPEKVSELLVLAKCKNCRSSELGSYEHRCRKTGEKWRASEKHPVCGKWLPSAPVIPHLVAKANDELWGWCPHEGIVK